MDMGELVMSHNKDRVLLRVKDIATIVLICTVLGIIGTQFRRVYRWDEAADRVERLEVRVTESEHVTIAISTQLEGISKQLEQINWQLRRMQNHGRDS
jgi:uncharacterized coiled-coil protein SlyX